MAVDKGMEETPKAIEEIQKDLGGKFKEATEEEAKTAESLFDKDWPTLEEVREKFVAKNSKENRQKLKDLLKEYKAESISELKEIYYKDVLKDLEKIA